eukprot:gene8307-9879_t
MGWERVNGINAFEFEQTRPESSLLSKLYSTMERTMGCLTLQGDSVESLDSKVPSKIWINKEKLIIGRGSPKLSVDVVIIARKNDKDIISRQHAEITTLSTGVSIIRDLGALNGIFVNGIKIQSHQLAHGDLVQFGGVCNVEIGTKLKNSDVSIKYVYSTAVSTPAGKAKADNPVRNSANSGITSSRGSKRSRGEDSLLYAVTTPVSALPSATKGTHESPDARHKAEVQSLHVQYLNQIEKLKQKAKDLDKELKAERAGQKNSSGQKAQLTDSSSVTSSSSPTPSCTQHLETMAVLEKLIADRDQKIATHEQSIIARDKSFENLKMEVGARDATIAAKEQNMELLSIQLATTAKALTSKDKTIQDLRSQVTTQAEKNELLTQELSMQQMLVEELQREVQVLTKKLSSTPKPATAPVANNSTTKEVSRNSVLGSLQCSLCEGLLVDAVVLRCSHGFCRACIEQHWKTSRDEARKKNKYSSKTSHSVVCRCPRCNALSPPVSSVALGDANSSKQRSVNVTSSKEGCSAHYVRSDHLDSLVWLMLEASSSAAERKDFEAREKASRQTLINMGVDPDFVPVLESQDEEESSVKKDNSDKAKASAESAMVGGLALFCDYCGGNGHPEAECPHRIHAHDSSSSEEEEEDSGNESDM